MSNTRVSYKANRDRLLRDIRQHLMSNDDFVAAWLFGSYARKTPELYSDIDLAVVISKNCGSPSYTNPGDSRAQPTPERHAFFKKFGVPAAVFEKPRNAPPESFFSFVLYEGSALIVDWIFVPEKQARLTPGVEVLFNRANIPSGPLRNDDLYPPITRPEDMIARFWMLAANTPRFIYRREIAVVEKRLHTLRELLDQVKGRSPDPATSRRSSSVDSSINAQVNRLLCLCGDLDNHLRQFPSLWAHPSPVKTIESLIDML